MNRVVHFELPADDMQRAQAFYQEAFGWTVNTVPGMGYALVNTTPTDASGHPQEPGGINGGMLGRQAPLVSPIITIEVEDIEQALARIAELGGSVLIGKQPVGDMGFSAYFIDSESNTVGLWQPAG
jgi:predicted enzyme related to lactoylglutathione lyase